MSEPRPVRMRTSRSRQRQRLRQAFYSLVALGFLYVSAWLIFSTRSFHNNPDQPDLKWAQGNLSHNLALLATSSVSSPLALPRRVVYPYSVIPGGIQSAEDLREVSEHDRIVGSHYAGFDFRNARIVELDQPRLMYLSYRTGDKVFWTAHRISLRKGEKLITDGKITARTRCANQVSESPQPTVSPVEPPAAAFEQPFAGTAAQIPFPGDFNAFGPARAFEVLGPAGPPALQAASYASFPGGGLPPVFAPPVPSKSCVPPAIKEAVVARSGKNNPCPTHKPPPSAVPEPTTVLLVSSGIAGIYLRRRKGAAKK